MFFPPDKTFLPAAHPRPLPVQVQHAERTVRDIATLNQMFSTAIAHQVRGGGGVSFATINLHLWPRAGCTREVVPAFAQSPECAPPLPTTVPHRPRVSHQLGQRCVDARRET